MGIEELKARFFESLDREAGSGTAAARAVGVNRNTEYGRMRMAGLRGRGKAGPAKHPEPEKYGQLRAAGVSRRVASTQVGVDPRTAKNWDRGWRNA